jgi:hypothetical protein
VGGTAWFVVVNAGLLGGDAAVTIPHFTDATPGSGLAFTYDGPFAFAVGGGVAVFDCNGDGKPDIYVAGGANPAGLFRNDSAIGGNLRFTRLQDPTTDLRDVNGAYPIDIDGDRNVDLVVLRNGVGNVLLRGLGGCRFQDATAAWGLQPGHAHTQAFSATWEPGSQWPTFAFGNYQDPSNPDFHSWCEPNELFRPAAAGSAFGPPIRLAPSYCTLSVLFSAWDGSGRKDLRVSNDLQYYDPYIGEEQLWRMSPGEPPRLYTAADGWQRVEVQGMGIASYDLTGDGLPEIYLTSQAASRLLTLANGPARPNYKSVGLDYGVNVTEPYTGADRNLPSTAWHPQFEDVNNDGRIDLFVSKGNVTAMPDFAIQDPSNLLLGQPDGTFKEAGLEAGIVDFDRGRGAALADFNLDGRLDLVESFYQAPLKIWENAAQPSDSAHWLGLELSEGGPNVDAIGAVIEVQAGNVTSRREVTIGGGHDGGQLGWVHFGLGRATSAQVRITWPDGTVGQAVTISADQLGTIDRSSDSFRPFVPAAQP